MRTVPIETANRTQLFNFLRREKGITDVVYKDASRESLIAKLNLIGYTGLTITVEDEPVVAAPTQKTVADDPMETEYETIIIDQTDGAGGDRPVPIMVNGVAILVERNKPQRLKKKFVEAIRNAVQGVVVQGADGARYRRDIPTIPWRYASPA